MGPVLYILFLIIGSVNSHLEITIADSKKVMDNQLYQDVLDPVVCEEQLTYLLNNTMLLGQFLDAGLRIPKGLLQGNFYDFGNFFQCLGINQELPDWTIQGKHCAVSFPLNQDISIPELPSWPDLPDIPWPELNPETSRIPKEVLKSLADTRQVWNRVATDSPLGFLQLQLAVCIPQTCTTKQFLDGLFVNISAFGVQYDEMYCRLPDDKQWVPVEYVAIVLLSLLGIIVISSTWYDIHQTVILRNDPKSLNKIYQSFSVYTNTRRLVTYTPVPGTIECVDGIRALAMVWVIVGHTYVNQLNLPLANPTAITDFITTINAIGITLGPITVDTFFMLGGLLLVYTTAGKFSRWRLLKTIHLFYLNRLLRMFPVLATFILIQASFLHRTADGPYWIEVERQTENCRTYWWSTLLYVQNWVNPLTMCLPHTWYLAIDVQLYVLSPLVLFWVLGCKKSTAWSALIGSLLLVLAGTAVFSFILEFQPWLVMPSRPIMDSVRFIEYYYYNTLTRGSPFFVGMIYGYLLHLNRGQKVVLSKFVATVLWCCAALIMAGIVTTTYLFMQEDWDNQLADNFINTFMKPAWALVIGWMVFACHHGYGGPINWVLCLTVWKVLSRLSYAMYIVHYTLIFFVDSTTLVPRYFSPSNSIFKFLADFSLAAMVSFVLTLLVDSPFSTLIKLAMGGGQRKPQPRVAENTNKDLTSGKENAAFEADTTEKIRL